MSNKCLDFRLGLGAIETEEQPTEDSVNIALPLRPYLVTIVFSFSSGLLLFLFFCSVAVEVFDESNDKEALAR